MADERENGTVSVHHATGSTYLGPLKNGRCGELKFMCQCHHVWEMETGVGVGVAMGVVSHNV